MEDLPILARRLKFNIPKNLPKNWNNNCPVKTHLFNSIAIIAPAFERLAISSVLPFKDQISDTKFLSHLKGFIGQESAHGSEFIRFNLCLKEQGYEIKKLEKRNLKQFKWLSSLLSKKMHLSLTLAAEHLTAIISDLILREKYWLEGAPLPCRFLWQWHAIEEIEHKAVVFDLFILIKGNYFLRIFGMGLMTSLLIFLLTSNFIYLVKKDKLLLKLSFWKVWFNVLWGKKGFIRKLIVPYVRYFLPGFHPWQQNNYNFLLKCKSDFKREVPNF